MIGLDGYTISSGIFPKYLQGDDIISIPLDEDEMMRIGYILNKDAELTELGEIYIDALKNTDHNKKGMEYYIWKSRNWTMIFRLQGCRLLKVNLESDFCFIGKTDEENSLVCLTEAVPDNTTERDDGWKAFRIQGVLDFH